MDSKNNIFDYLKFDNDKDIKIITQGGKSFFNSKETIIFTDKIIKINRFNMKQERNFILTSNGIYNMKSKSLKRRIDLKDVQGVTVSKVNYEFVIHCCDIEYDYYYVSTRVMKIVELISQQYKYIHSKELMLFNLENKPLKEVVTQKSEKKNNKNFSKMPVEGKLSIHFYLYGVEKPTPESKEQSSSKEVKEIKDSKNMKEEGKDEEIKENMRVIKAHGIIENIPEIPSPPTELEEVEMENPKLKWNNKKAKLDDFQVLKVLGRGSFGKVCLVENVHTKELYAMKSLKKDILLNQEQIENTLQEKQILQSMNHPFLVSLDYFFQTMERLYFIMTFMRGGELFEHLRKYRVLDEEK